MLIKKREIRGEIFISLCDKNLIGKRLKQGEINFFVDPRFYKGEEKTKEEILKEIKNASILNVVGKESVELCIKAGIISKESVICIKKVPHAQMVIVR